MKTFALIILVSIAIGFASAHLHAQGATAAISGTVLDPTVPELSQVDLLAEVVRG